MAPASPQDFSAPADVRPKSVLGHHNLIDSVHLLNDEEDDDEDSNTLSNIDRKTVDLDDKSNRNVKIGSTLDDEQVKINALVRRSGTVAFKPTDPPDSVDPWEPSDCGCSMEKIDAVKSLPSCETLMKQISPKGVLTGSTNATCITGTRMLSSANKTSYSMESVSKAAEPLKNKQSPRIAFPHMNS